MTSHSCLACVSALGAQNIGLIITIGHSSEKLSTVVLNFVKPTLYYFSLNDEFLNSSRFRNVRIIIYTALEIQHLHGQVNSQLTRTPPNCMVYAYSYIVINFDCKDLIFFFKQIPRIT